MEIDDVLPCRKFAFSIGHFLNDLCASVWFSYSLVFYHRVAKFSNSSAGYLLLIGQVADALATAFVGFASDRTKHGLCGKRKSWHLLGVVCVLSSFSICFQLENESLSSILPSFIYYTIFIVIFQFGWACSQIGHLSMLNELTSKDGERVALNAYRHAWSIVANIFVYTVTWLLLNKNQTRNNTEMNENVFQMLTHIIIITGFFTSLIFHLGSKELPSITIISITSHTWRDVLCDIQFYLISFIWMLTRVMSNVSQVYLPLYIMDTTDASEVDRTFIAIGPLCVYISGFITSFPMRKVNQYLGRKKTMIVGLMSVLLSSFLFWHIFSLKINFGISMQFTILIGAMLLGIGITTAQITSSAFTSDLIGQNTESSAFVYGAMSFLDKLANGLAITVIQQYNPCSTCSTCCPLFYRKVLSFVSGVTAICTLLILTRISRTHSSTRQTGSARQSLRSLWDQIMRRTIKVILTKIV
ncbi:unnamed protein product [Rotaria sp. Silwood2]|nr:unnamed protein product [Rotaria sp. Silwood2]CAF2625382.1 unnamed protein product [Rotaria sp. Silwood2]CAF2845502.1 unnamed protein product [Rotaria sp. Silwood2]CAF4206500.1 unnamed protein product [Rotaria sp. Silwood2]CAF4261465.1 unnamed protein product [Rotaria sp. Silwood2]